MINKKEILTSSNLLSTFRLFLAVPFWFLLNYFDNSTVRYYAFGLALFASFTDIMDGFLARKLNQVTEFGKIIDPLADKVCVGVIIIKLFLIGEISTFYFLLIVLRDLIIFTGGVIISKKIGKVLPSNALGKITVIIIGIVILLIFINVERNNLLFKSFYYSSILLSIASLIGYALRASEFLKHNKYESV